MFHIGLHLPKMSFSILIDSRLETTNFDFIPIPGAFPKIDSPPITFVHLPRPETILTSFLLYWDENLIGTIANSSNQYYTQRIQQAQQNNQLKRPPYSTHHIQPFTSRDVLGYLTIRLFMGVVKLPEISMYRSTNKGLVNTAVSKIMPILR